MYDTTAHRPMPARRTVTLAEIEARAHAARSETAYGLMRALRRALVGGR